MVTETKRCPNCGTSAEAGDSFCHNCGSRIEQQSESNSNAPSSRAQQGTEGMSVVTRQVQVQINFDPQRDWPLIGATITVILSFLMLFPPWISGDYHGNAFKEIGTLRVGGLVGPVLIAAISFLGLLSIILAIVSAAPRYSNLALIFASNLFIIYLVEAGVIYEWSNTAKKAGEVSITVGVGIWLGMVFSFLTVGLLTLAHALRQDK
jgi:hypothetical protein